MAPDDTGVKLQVRALSTFLPHEEVMPANVDMLADEIRRDGIQKDPLIVDETSGIVLDGMHRLAAFSLLRVRHAVCSLVDYNSSAIVLGRWARKYSGPLRKQPSELLSAFGFSEEATLESTLLRLGNRSESIAAFCGGKAFLPTTRVSLQRAFDIVRELDAAVLESGGKRLFLPEEEIRSAGEPGNVVLMVARLSKEDVISAAKSGSLFPCKTSMHSVDPRPVAVRFPLAELDGDHAASLVERIAKAKGRIIPPNSSYGGRRYKERLLLLREE